MDRHTKTDCRVGERFSEVTARRTSPRELAGLKWNDVDFAALLLNVVRSVVDERTGKCKTEASAKPAPFDEYPAGDLLASFCQIPMRLAALLGHDQIPLCDPDIRSGIPRRLERPSGGVGLR